MTDEPRVAVVHDWLDTWRGGENVLAEILRLYPAADLFSLVDFLPSQFRELIGDRHARTSFLQRLPGARSHFRALLPLFTRAIESLDVSAYNLVISSSHAVAKGVRTTRSQLHVCYCHTPMRYAWDQRDHYLQSASFGARVARPLVRHVLNRLREWDRTSSQRVHRFIANSEFVKRRIARYYGRDADVIFPPVDVDFFLAAPNPPQRTYYVTAARFVPYKRADLVVAAFRELRDRRLVVIGAGPEAPRIRALAGDNVELVGEVPRERLRALLGGARAFIFAAEEDFGIFPVEAQACGTPVVAFGGGGALETVRGAPQQRATGIFFREQTKDALVEAVIAFEQLAQPIDAADCREHAQLFSTPRFRRDFTRFIENAWRDFRRAER